MAAGRRRPATARRPLRLLNTRHEVRGHVTKRHGLRRAGRARLRCCEAGICPRCWRPWRNEPRATHCIARRGSLSPAHDWQFRCKLPRRRRPRRQSRRPRATLERAVALMGGDRPVVARSAWLATPALIHPDDPAQSYPEFLNGAVLCARPAPEAILAGLHRIEARLGRDRSQETARWRPRLIDLDLIAVEDLVVDDGPAAAASRDAQARFRARTVLRGLAGLAPPGAGPDRRASCCASCARLSDRRAPPARAAASARRRPGTVPPSDRRGCGSPPHPSGPPPGR